MELPRFNHVIGRALWERCYHRDTVVHEPTASSPGGLDATVRIAPLELSDDAAAGHPTSRASSDLWSSWEARRGGMVLFECGPDDCVPRRLLLADPDGTLYGLIDGRWLAITGARPAVEMPGGAWRFGPQVPAEVSDRLPPLGALARDGHQRLWLLHRGENRIDVLAPGDLRLLDVVRGPPGEALTHLTTTAWGVVAAGERLWRRGHGGEWSPVTIPEGFRPVSVAGGETFSQAVAVLRPEPADSEARPRLVAVQRATEQDHPLTGVDEPLALLMVRDDEVLVGEIESPPGHGLHRFHRYRVVEGEGLAYVGMWAVRGFDGRGLALDTRGNAFASTARGVRPLFERKPRLTAAGVVETFALDSEMYGSQWHRIYLDVCLPQGTSVQVEAKTADDLPRLPLPLPPPTDESEAAAQYWGRHPIGSRFADDPDGWIDLGVLDRRPGLADVPFPPERGAPPSQDPYGPRISRRVPAFETLEGLIKNGRGRYLWLRIRLVGDRRHSPDLIAARASHSRPSLLDHLPAFWRADPDAARAMDHTLSLFEGPLTELHQRTAEMGHLFDPLVCPEEGLAWLASFVGLVFDSRLKESVRRQLLSEIAVLYTRRGTLPGLQRLLSILAEARVSVVEGFRLRRRAGAFLGARRGGDVDETRGVLGPGLQLGAYEGDLRFDRVAEEWEESLLYVHAELRRRRARQQQPCPPRDPPFPVDSDPVRSFYRRYAHRFSVLVFRDSDPVLESILETAIEANKPAHSLHTVCWLQAGFRLGANTYVGIGTRIADTSRFHPAILDADALGWDATLGRRAPREQIGTLVGEARVAHNIQLG